MKNLGFQTKYPYCSISCYEFMLQDRRSCAVYEDRLDYMKAKLDYKRPEVSTIIDMSGRLDFPNFREWRRMKGLRVHSDKEFLKRQALWGYSHEIAHNVIGVASTEEIFKIAEKIYLEGGRIMYKITVGRILQEMGLLQQQLDFKGEVYREMVYQYELSLNAMTGRTSRGGFALGTVDPPKHVVVF